MRTLASFIKEARSKGYSDLQIRAALLEKGWALESIEKVFLQLNPKFKLKNQICIFLSQEILKKLEARARKNMFTVSEQIEDILRRSCIGIKKSTKEEKLDDTLVALFSRKR